MINIFDIENGKVIINVNCLLIPELKAVHEAYENPITAFCFLYYMTDPKSPYNNLSEDQREERIYSDYPGDYTLDDEAIENARIKLKELVMTPTMNLLQSAKIGLEKLSAYLKVSEITSGRDGNMTAYISSLKSISQINKEFKQLEKQAEEEVQVQGRGGIEWGYDQL